MSNIGKIFWVAMLIILLLIPAQSQRATKSWQELQLAFSQDGYDTAKTVTYQGKLGILAVHRTAVNYETKKPKKVFYVEGNAYQMGYLMGLLGYEDVERMSTEFVDKIVFDFIKLDIDPNQIPLTWSILKGIMLSGAKAIQPDIAEQNLQEMNGLVDGCRQSNPNSKVEFDNLLLLNVGIDALVSQLYALNKGGETRLDPKNVTIPVMCNAFSVFGNATVDGKHYFGRDFMFPTASVYEHTGCLIIYCPDDGRLPMVCVSAPGFVGAIAAMNIEGIGMGVDMLPANNCNPDRPGINSLLMVRNAAHRGYSAQHCVDVIVETQRGTSWLYFIADGKNDKAVVAETGMKTDDLNPLSYALQELQWFLLLPDKSFLDEYENQQHKKGIMLRWNDYQYPSAFFDFNSALFSYFGKNENPDMWGERGYINAQHDHTNCPAAYYFAPQRENREDVLLVTNHAIVPSMRLCGMNYWTVLVAEHKYNDIQWRYDELNAQILNSYGKIDEAKAIALIDFLSPYRKFPDYYKDNKTSSDGTTKCITGSVSLCNLTDKVIHTYLGYFKDAWITITLPNYVE